jgi:hypothetical protein
MPDIGARAADGARWNSRETQCSGGDVRRLSFRRAPGTAGGRRLWTV